MLKTQELQGPQSGLCPGPARDLKWSPDPFSNFAPPTSNPGSAPVDRLSLLK